MAWLFWAALNFPNEILTNKPKNIALYKWKNMINIDLYKWINMTNIALYKCKKLIQIALLKCIYPEILIKN